MLTMYKSEMCYTALNALCSSSLSANQQAFSFRLLIGQKNWISHFEFMVILETKQ